MRSGCAWYDGTASKRRPSGRAAIAASMYFLDAQRRELRRHGNADDARDTGAAEFVERVLDERLPVAHPDGHRHVGSEPRPQRRSLRVRDVGERRAPADRLRSCARISATSSSEAGRPPRTSAKILRHLVDRGRRPMRHQQHTSAVSQTNP